MRLAFIITLCCFLGRITARPHQDSDSSHGQSNGSQLKRDCIRSCAQMAEGDYPSCHGCHLYTTCQSGHIIDRRKCPPGQVFDDVTRRCDLMSDSCDADDDKTSFMDMSPESELLPSTDPSRMPNHLELSFSFANGQQVTLNLTRSTHLSHDFPLYSGTSDGGIEELDFRGSPFSFYTDMNMEATIIIGHSENASEGKHHEYRGMFTMENETYFLQPLRAEHRERKRRDAQSAPTYVCRALREAMTDMDVEPAVLNPAIAALADAEQAALDLAYEAGTAPTGRQRHTVETILFLDYAVYENWYRLSLLPTHAERHRETLESLRYYYAIVINGVDSRYQGIRDPSFEVKVKLNAMYIAQRPEESPWTEYNRNGYYTEAYDSLDDFELWLINNIQQLPPFDQATLFSGYFLYSGYKSDGTPRTISGLADIKGVCRYGDLFYGASINFDNGIYAATTTAAHEMGHNLGAYHDGSSNAANCTGRDQFIMASSPGVLTDDNYRNGFNFSPCSIYSIRQYLTSLTLMNTNCLLNPTDYPEVDTEVDELPGLRFTPDYQCQIRYGQGSYYCAGGDNDANICRQMPCYVPSTDQCYIPPEQRAADGTTCGNKRWCMFGDCVYDENAPSAPESCIYGDYRGRLVSYHNVRCSDFIANSAFQCYDGFDVCCESCAAVRDDSRPGCEFGDHVPFCRANQDIYARDCYSENTRRDCCATCADFQREYNAGPGCEYGDKASWCDQTIRVNNEHFRCYSEAGTCCRTCELLRNEALPDCAYGDRASWCSSLSAKSCYNSYNAFTCCETCGRFATEDQTCPFGYIDQSSYCQRSQCSNPGTWSSCCYTCYNEILSARTTTTPTTTTTTRPTTTTTTTHVAATVTSTGTTPRSGEGDVCIDSASYCSSMPALDCYLAIYRNICCQRCRNAYTGHEDCQYGDKASWCPGYISSEARGGDCSTLSASIQQTCCMSCINLTGTTTTIATSTVTTAASTPSTTLPTTITSTTKPPTSTTSTATSTAQTTSKTTPTTPTTTPTTTLTTSTTASTTTTPTTTTRTPTTSTTTTTPTTTTSTTTTTMTSIIQPAEPYWCARLFRGNCYDQATERICYARCASLKDQSNPACSYGNRYTWCRQAYCSSFGQECCESCP